MRVAAIRMKIPVVSAYVVGGVLLGGSLFLWMPGGREFVERWLYTDKILVDFDVVTQIALAIISLSIGAELEWRQIKNLGKSIIIISIFESLIAFILVTIVTYLIWRDLSLSVVLGAISSATAPPATVAVIQQYKAKGPLTSTVLAVVGLDDAVSFMIFAFSLSIAKGTLRGEHIDLVVGLVSPVKDILISLFVGTAGGLIAAKLVNKTRDHDNLVFILGALIFVVAGIASIMNVSALLANMACGMILVNVNPQIKNKIRLSFGPFSPVFYALFFIIGGAYLNLYSLPLIWFISIIYFLSRSLGKVSGAYIGAVLGSALPQVRKWVGLTLLPQVGAAIALALVIQNEFGSGSYGDAGVKLSQTVMNILLVTTLLTESIGPYLTKISLFKAGEARE